MHKNTVQLRSYVYLVHIHKLVVTHVNMVLESGLWVALQGIIANEYCFYNNYYHRSIKLSITWPYTLELV